MYEIRGAEIKKIPKQKIPNRKKHQMREKYNNNNERIKIEYHKLNVYVDSGFFSSFFFV